MSRNFLYTAIFTLFYCSVGLAEKSVEIGVELFPAGSFQIKTEKIKGKVYQDKQGQLSAENVKILVKNLQTGIELRDEHLHKKLGYETDPKVTIDLVKLQGQGGKGEAIFSVLGKEQTVAFVYEISKGGTASSDFKLKLSDFGITGISYMGVGVEDTVTVKVQIPVEVR